MGSTQTQNNSNNQVEIVDDNKEENAVQNIQNENQENIENKNNSNESQKLKINKDQNSNNENNENHEQPSHLVGSSENLIDANNEQIPKEEKKEEEANPLEDVNKKSYMRKSKLNNITFVQNLKEFFPEEISKEEVKCMVMNALSGYIVNNKKNFILGKTVTREQAEAIADLVYEKIKMDENCKIEDYENNDETNANFQSLDDVKIIIRMSDLNREIVKKIFFKDKENPTDEEINKTIQSVSQGNDNVKILTIELLAK